MIISTRFFLFIMLVLGIAVLVTAFFINSDIAKCKSLLAQKCLRGLFIMGSTMVAIPITSFIVCSNIDGVGSEFKGTLLVWFMFLIGCTITALSSIINYECKNERSKTFYPIIIGVVITLTCLMYFFSSKSTKTKPTGQQQKISPSPNQKIQPEPETYVPPRSTQQTRKSKASSQPQRVRPKNTGQLQLPAPPSSQTSSQYKAQPKAKPTTQPKAQPQPRPVGDGWGCVRPYNKDTATGKQRATSCEKSATGTYPNRQLCVQECHL